MTISVMFEVLNRANAPLGNIKKMFSDVGGAVDRTTDRMMKMNQSVEMIDKMGAAAQRISQPYREFEQSMAELSSITGIAGDGLDHLGKVARKSGVDSGLGAKGAVNAFALLASQIQVADIGMEGLVALQERTITLAQASGMTMDESALALAGTVNQFGLQATEAKRVIDVLAAGAKYGAASIPELSQSFKVVGAAANAAGLSVEQTAGALEVLSKNNLKGAEAGTALRNIMLKMQTALGVDFTKTSMSQALTALKPKMKDATYMAKIFGMENMAAAQFMIANADAVDKLTQQVTGTDVAQEQAAINTNTWNHRLQVQSARLEEWGMKLTENHQGLLNTIQIGSQFSSMFLAFTPLITAAGSALVVVGKTSLMAVRGIIRVASSSKAAAVGVWLKNAALAAGNGIMIAYNALTTRAGFATMYHALAAKSGAIWTAMCSKAQLAGGAIMSLWTKRTVLATIVQGGLTNALRMAKVAMLTGVIPALTGVIASTWAWTVALLANPITWIVLGITALVAAVAICWEKFAGFRAVIYTIWDTIKGFGQAIIDWIIAPFKAAGSLVAGLSGAVGKVFSGDLGGAWDSLKEGFGGAADAFAQPVKDAVATANGISGNYKIHLTEEQKKQSEKQTKSDVKKQQPTIDGAGIPVFSGFVDMAMPKMATTAIAQPVVSGYSAENATDVTGKQTATNINMSPLGGMASAPAPAVAQPATEQAPTIPAITINFQPTINISSEMTQKAKDDLLTILKKYAPELAKIVTEEIRKSNRGNYGILAIG